LNIPKIIPSKSLSTMKKIDYSKYQREIFHHPNNDEIPRLKVFFLSLNTSQAQFRSSH
jgi:hypothetical protein